MSESQKFVMSSDNVQFTGMDHAIRAWRCLWCDRRGLGEPKNLTCPTCKAQTLAVFHGSQFDHLTPSARPPRPPESDPATAP